MLGSWARASICYRYLSSFTNLLVSHADKWLQLSVLSTTLSASTVVRHSLSAAAPKNDIVVWYDLQMFSHYDAQFSNKALYAV